MFSVSKKVKKTVILVLALIVGVAIALVALLMAQTRGVDKYFIDGERAYEIAFDKLDAQVELLGKAPVGKETTDAAFDSKRMIREIGRARKELRAAGRSFTQMRRLALTDWEKNVAESSRESVARALEGAADLEHLLNFLQQVKSVQRTTSEAVDLYGQAFAKTNASITASNEDRFGDGRRLATEARDHFSRSRDLFLKLETDLADQEAGRAAAKLNQAVAWTAVAEELAVTGEKKNFKDYNKLVDEHNRLSRQVAAISEERVFADSKGWLASRFEKIGDDLEETFRKADSWREKALAVWRDNT